MSAVDAFGINHRLQRIEPFASFLRVYVLNRFHQTVPAFSRCFELRARRLGGAPSTELHFAPTATKVHRGPASFPGGLACLRARLAPAFSRAGARASQGASSPVDAGGCFALSPVTYARRGFAMGSPGAGR